MAYALELKHITKAFGDFYANKDINLSIEEGMVYSLLGENGAGKSTLMNVLYGLLQPTEGEILIDGKAVKIHSPKDAIRQGIGMVHQHFMLIPTLTVAENIVLATDERKNPFFDKKGVIDEVRKICDKYGFVIDPSLKVSELTVGQQQKVEIVKAIYHDCHFLILDEPTAVLTPRETEELYTIIEQFRAEKKSVIFISHKLHEVMHVSDRISVLRGGELVADFEKTETNEQERASCMVGKDVSFTVAKDEAEPGDTVLTVDRLVVKGVKGNRKVNELSLTVHAGEIYGIAGVDGNGQTELIEAITCLRKAESGNITILGENTTNQDSGKVLAQGVSHIPEDRQHMGILMNRSLMDNLILYDVDKKDYHKGLFVDWKKAEEHANETVQKYDIKMTDMHANISALSGGNQQKAVVARELEKKPRLLLAVHPTRGVDIGAIEFIHSEIVKARDEGCAVLLISTELDEIMSLSDRIGVIFEGSILGEMDQKNATIEKIGMYMAGMKDE
ncbi:MAG: ABC transporter ATP-binding protein [Lachnospiraceae bacterium]|nr:ABC transporter ATP-binding protein [Lachnospiraceae bacterium]